MTRLIATCTLDPVGHNSSGHYPFQGCIFENFDTFRVVGFRTKSEVICVQQQPTDPCNRVSSYSITELLEGPKAHAITDRLARPFGPSVSQGAPATQRGERNTPVQIRGLLNQKGFWCGCLT